MGREPQVARQLHHAGLDNFKWCIDRGRSHSKDYGESAFGMPWFGP
jgi:hypothetical protein